MSGTAVPPNDSVVCCESDVCRRLREEIDQRINRNKHDRATNPGGRGIHGLVHQFREVRAAVDRGDFSRVQTHLNEIRGNQGKLQEALRKYQDEGCGDPPPGAWSWSERSTREFEDALAQHNQNANLRTAASWGLAAGAGYAAYRAIRLIPSLIPAGWWSLPANLVTP